MKVSKVVAISDCLVDLMAEGVEFLCVGVGYWALRLARYLYRNHRSLCAALQLAAILFVGWFILYALGVSYGTGH